jgi:hypothetical protein
VIGQAILNLLHDFGIGLGIACLAALALWAESWVEKREAAAMRSHVKRRPGRARL